MQNWIQRTIGLTILPLALYGAAYAQASAGAVVMRTAQAANENPFAAGKTAAQALKTAMGAAEIKGVFYAECFEDKANKEAVLKGIESVLGAGKVAGGAVYGSYTQGGVLTEDAVALLGIGGEGVSVTLALDETLGAAGVTIEKDKDKLTQALGTAGNRLAKKLGNTGDASLLILLGDAHSPKNQLLLDGVQAVVGKKLPITGGSLNKNSGQNWLGFNGKLYTMRRLPCWSGVNQRWRRPGGRRRRMTWSSPRRRKGRPRRSGSWERRQTPCWPSTAPGARAS